MRIALLCGSIREASVTNILLRHLSDSLSRELDTVEFDLIDLRETPLPLFDGSKSNREQANEFIERLNLADGFLIASPEYHNSFSGVLKNAFDFVSSDQMKNKPVGLIAMSGGGKGGINCLNSMRTFLRGLYALVLPDQVVVDRHLIESGRLVNDVITLKIKTLAEEVMNFAILIHLKNKNSFMAYTNELTPVSK